MQKERLYGKTFNEIKEVVASMGLPKFTAQQISDWLYKKDVNSIAEMSNLSKSTRQLLEERFEMGLNPPISESTSTDGTKKYLYSIGPGKYVEAAFIPEETRNTLCISSQVGCKMACTFCMTGHQKFHGQLSVNEILNQLRSLPEFREVSNIVYMGMGEPMDNLQEVLKSLEILTADYALAWSPKRINVSTIGVLPAVEEFIQKSKAHLAISLHSPFDDERQQLMPMQKAFPIKQVLNILRKYDWSSQRRLSFEYIVFDGLNHSERHVKELARILNGLKFRINLIRFHQIPDSPLKSSDADHILLFQQQLKNKGIITTIRASRGQDIDAACGLLSTKKLLSE